MMSGIERVAPAVVNALAVAGETPPGDVDRSSFAGEVILQVAEAAHVENWGDDEFQQKAEAKTIECIATGAEEFPISPGGAMTGQSNGGPETRAEVLAALANLGTLRLRVLALILQEGLNVAETAAVLGLPEWRVHQECADAVGQIRRQVYV